MTKTPETKRKHRATYAADKKKGGYLIRVQGPNASEFAGRSVPVTTKAGDEHSEELDRMIWAGNDDGVISGYVGPCALYSFKAKPKEAKESEF